MRRDLRSTDIKLRLLGHWGTSAGLGFIYAHTSRAIRQRGQRTVFFTGPGHGGPSLTSASWLEGTWADATRTRRRTPTACAPCSAASPHPAESPATSPSPLPGRSTRAASWGTCWCMPSGGDGQPGPAGARGGRRRRGRDRTAGRSWKGISFLNPKHDGAVLPILHLNGYKIAGPTVLARKDPAEVRALFAGHGYEVLEVTGDDVPGMHHRFAQTLDTALSKIAAIQQQVRTSGFTTRPRWPMIILRSPKGWTGPASVDGVKVTDSWRAHQVPLSGSRATRSTSTSSDLAAFLPSGGPFDDTGAPVELVTSNNPEGDLRMSAARLPTGHRQRAAGDARIRQLRRAGAVPATERMESPRVLGAMMRDLYVDNPTSFASSAPTDEFQPHRRSLRVSDRAWMEHLIPDDVKISPDGRVMEVLSEHNCHGWLEAYTLTGRHGLFATYEAFAMVSASMTIQHGKWLEESIELPWRAPVPSLNILLTSTCWRNDHNGFSTRVRG